MREAGLISGSDSEVSLWSSEREPASSQSRGGGRANKRQKHGLRDDSGFLSVVEDVGPALGGYKSPPEVSDKPGKQQRSSGKKQYSSVKGLGEDGIAFDYSAAREAVPGLSLTLEEEQGRGGRGGRRGMSSKCKERKP